MPLLLCKVLDLKKALFNSLSKLIYFDNLVICGEKSKNRMWSKKQHEVFMKSFGGFVKRIEPNPMPSKSYFILFQHTKIGLKSSKKS